MGKKSKYIKRQFISSLLICICITIILSFLLLYPVNSKFIICGDNILQVDNYQLQIPKYQRKMINTILFKISKKTKFQTYLLISTDTDDTGYKNNLTDEICIVYQIPDHNMYLFFNKKLQNTFKMNYNNIYDNICELKAFITSDSYIKIPESRTKTIIITNIYQLCIFVAIFICGVIILTVILMKNLNNIINNYY